MGKFFKLKNGQWLKIIFSYAKFKNVWYMSIVIANTKRRCNDCFNKTENSPKVFYGKQTGHKAGLEPFIIALKELKWLEQFVNNCEIQIIGTSDRLKKYINGWNEMDIKLKL